MTISRWSGGALPLAVVAALLSTPVQAQTLVPPRPGRPLTVDDLLNEEQGPSSAVWGGAYALSRDGRELALAWVRPQSSWGHYDSGRLAAYVPYADILVWTDARPGQPHQLTDGASDGSGWWAPQWSPDGKILAMLSSRGGTITLWTWDAARSDLHQLTKRPIDLSSDYRLAFDRPYVWVDAQHILYPALPSGARPAQITTAVETTWNEWTRQRDGKLTASVLESGVAPSKRTVPRGQLLLVDVLTGSSRVIAGGSTASWQVAPGGRVVAFLVNLGPFSADSGDLTPPSNITNQYVAEIASLDSMAGVQPHRLGRDILVGSLRWSPDGSEIAALDFAGPRKSPPRLLRMNRMNGRVRAISLDSLDAGWVDERARLEWTGHGDIILLAAHGAGRVRWNARHDWWLIGADGTQQDLTGQMSTPPWDLSAEQGREAFVGEAEGAVWELTPRSRRIVKLTANGDSGVAHILWPTHANVRTAPFTTLPWAYQAEQSPSGQAYSRAVISVTETTGQRALYLVDLRSRATHMLEPPSASASVTAFAPATGRAIYFSDDSGGTRMWEAMAPEGSPKALLARNSFRSEIGAGEVRAFHYTSSDGEDLLAKLILPLGYQPGRRYPLVTNLYPVPADQQILDEIVGSIGGGHQLYAARGYAVLIPSVPLRGQAEFDDLLLRLPGAVIPAVQKAIELGIADPDRLFLVGWSWGGYSTMAMITQTTRFTAAAEGAGFSDAISGYGTFTPRTRYSDVAHLDFYIGAQLEHGYARLRVPPWRDLNRYLRNSPISYMDRVHTPLLLIQGDQDAVPIQQSEEFFSALHRQGKRAEFVRYWGEGHAIESPANVRDMWERVFAWFDEVGDIERDANGKIVFDGTRAKRRGASTDDRGDSAAARE